MTLIVGTTHWNGICLNSDTRVTNKVTGAYLDNALKLTHIHSGFGMVASGDRQSAIVVRETIRKTLDEFASSGVRFDHTVDLSGVTEKLLLASLKNARKHKIHEVRSIYETESAGLIGVSIPDQKLTLGKVECTNLTSIVVEGCQGLTLDQNYYQKYMMKVLSCANGEIPDVVFDEYPQSILYRYKLKLYDDESQDIYEIKRIPFGEIVAMGSGSDFDYSSKRDRVLFFTLFNGDYNDVGLGSLHLSMIHEFAETLAPVHKVFSIKTFGGAIIPGMINTLPNGNGNTGIVECDLGNKIENRIISKTYHRGKNLWVKTRSGKSVKLVPFPDEIDIKAGMYW